jgi:hypothetical protein
MKEKFLSVGIDRHTPRVRNAKLGMAYEPAGTGIVTVKSAVRTTLRAEGGFHVTMQEYSFAHNNGTGRVRTERGNRMVGIMVIEPRKQNFTLIVLVISVRVLKENQTSALGNINPIVGDFETNGDVKVVSKVDLFVCLAIVIGVFENDQFVFW